MSCIVPKFMHALILCGHDYDDVLILYVRWLSSYVHGNRVLYYVDAFWVETFFSFSPPSINNIVYQYIKFCLFCQELINILPLRLFNYSLFNIKSNKSVDGLIFLYQFLLLIYLLNVLDFNCFIHLFNLLCFYNLPYLLYK